jgi:VCBS repeat-containing protein
MGDGQVLDRAAVEDHLAHNLAPVLAADSAQATEDVTTPVAGNVLANDSDPEGRALRVTTAGTFNGKYGKLTLAGDGSYSYVLDSTRPAVQALAAGQSLTESFAYTAADDDPAGAASASSALTITIRGANDAPVVNTDWNSTYEDDTSALTGNVLGNDQDVDAGTVLRVAQPGLLKGAYGTLTMNADGSYAYALNNDLAAVQSLGGSSNVTDEFHYTVTDGIANVASTLSIGVFGSNDAPVLAVPLADQTVAPNSSYQWTIPAGSFTDVDAGDVLSTGARLADGSDLPSWLTFNGATGTFSGRVPSDAAGYLDIEVEVTDGTLGSGSQEGAETIYDTFRLTFGTVKGGGGGGNGGGNHGGGNGGGNGGGKGNEGVGNGEDPPPPGHDTNQNDGPGTSPGHPGNKGGKPAKQGGSDLIALKPAPGKINAGTLGHGQSEGTHGTNRQRGLGKDADLASAAAYAPEAATAASTATSATSASEPAGLLAAGFNGLADYLAGNGQASGAGMSARQISQQWDLVRGLQERLALDDAHAREGALAGRGDIADGQPATALFGYAGAIGQARAAGGMQAFNGLDEGFQKLG